MWCLAVLSLLAAALPAGAAADVSLGPPINVPPNGSTVYSVPLTAGVTYRVVLTGTVTQTAIGGGCPPCITYDGRWATADVLVVQSTNLDLYYEGEASFPPYWWDLNPSTPIPLPDFSSHRYEETFTAARSGRLEARVNLNLALFEYRGGFTVELFGPAPAPSPPTGPSGGGSPGADKPATVLPPAKWGKAGPATPLGPGDGAIALGPQIASGQTQATVTVSSDPPGQPPLVAVGVPTSTSKKEPPKKVTGGDCVRAALRVGSLGLHSPTNQVGSVTLSDEETESVSNFTLFMIACLDYVKQQDKQASPAPLARAVGTARSSCGLGTASLSVRVDRAAGKAHYRSRRASRRGPARRLRVSCRQAGNGTVTMRIKTRSRRTKLRKVLGKRLVVGLYRPRAATGTANVRTTFKRR